MINVRGGDVILCRTCDCEVVGSNPACGCRVPTLTQRAVPPGSVNEYEWKLVSKWTRCTSPVSVVLRLRLVSSWGIRKRRSAPPHGHEAKGLYFFYFIDVYNLCLYCRLLGTIEFSGSEITSILCLPGAVVQVSLLSHHIRWLEVKIVKQFTRGHHLQCESKKPPPAVFWHFFPNGWEFLINFVHTYYTFLSTLDYKFLFNYLQLWRSYAILSETIYQIFLHFTRT